MLQLSDMGGGGKKLNRFTLTILDPACGSGSFLVRAYDYLLKWYLEQYTKDKVLKKNLKDGKIYEAGSGGSMPNRQLKQSAGQSEGGVHVKRYFIKYPDLNLIYTKKKDDFKKIPNICSYIDNFKDRITCREVKQKKHSLYALHRPRTEKTR